VPGFEVFCSETLVTRGKTRLLALVKRGTYTRLTVNNNEFNELIFLQKNEMIVVGGYRPFKTYAGETLTSNFERMLSSLNEISKSKTALVVGDFNVDVTKVDAPFRDRLVSWLDNHNLEVSKVGHTRIRNVSGKLQKSSIDLVATNVPSLGIEKVFSDLSDHCLLHVSSKGNESIQNKRTIDYLDWKNFDPFIAANKLERNLASVSSMFDAISSPCELDYRIRTSVSTVFQESVKTRRITIRDFDEFSPLITRLSNRKKRLRKIWLKNPCVDTWKNFTLACTKLRREVAKVRKARLSARINKGTKEFWGEVKRMMGDGSPSLLKIVKDGEVITDKKRLADEFIDFFVGKVNEKLGGYSEKDWSEIVDSEEAANHPIFSESDVFKKLGFLREIFQT